MENVRKSYKDFTLDCSMQVPEGYITGLIGANGAGKAPRSSRSSGWCIPTVARFPYSENRLLISQSLISSRWA